MKIRLLISAMALSSLPMTNAVLATEMAKFPDPQSQLSVTANQTANGSGSSMNPANGTCGGAGQEACMYVISNTHINRIVTPFNHPSIKIDALNGVEHKAKDNIVYLSTVQDTPIAGFITEQGDESAAIKFVLKPVPTGPQEVVLQHSSIGGSEMARKFERSSARDETFTNVLSAIAKGSFPVGYELKPFNPSYLPTCNQAGLTFDFINGQFVSGGDYVVSIGTVKNTNFGKAELKENNCYKEGVVAVSAYPSPYLMPGDSAEVYVMYYRNKPYVGQKKQRQSLIGGH